MSCAMPPQKRRSRASTNSIAKKRTRSRKAVPRKAAPIVFSLSPSVLEIDSNTDAPTQFVSSFRIQKLYPAIAQSGLTVVARQGSLAMRAYVANDAAQSGVVFITASGHGLPNCFLGQYDTIWQVGQYAPAEVAGKIVHLLACNTALTLGPDMVRNGATAFFGYDAEFVFTDETVNTFCDCACEIDRALCEGLSARDAMARAETKFNSAIDAYKSSGPSYAAAMLATNLAHLKSPKDDPMWGDPNAKVY